MILATRHPWLLLSMLVVPLLTLASPAWLRIAGIPPAWAPLWLLPWALVDGQLSGSVAGLCLGLLLDSLHPGPVSAIPALLLLGWWWGRLGYQGPPIERSFNLALLAMIGTLGLNLSLMAQWAWRSWLGLRGLQGAGCGPLWPCRDGMGLTWPWRGSRSCSASSCWPLCWRPCFARCCCCCFAVCRRRVGVAELRGTGRLGWWRRTGLAGLPLALGGVAGLLRQFAPS
jgi:hypothetical protein